MLKLVKHGERNNPKYGVEYAELGKKLRILVVEDKEKHIAGIERLLQEGHEVDVAKDFLDAKLLLCGGYKQVGKSSWDKEKVEAKKYDVVLTDLFFPYGERAEESLCFGDNDHERYEENPLGYAVALKAAQLGVPYVAIITDLNHHAGPVAATFDLFPKFDQEVDEKENITRKAVTLNINGAKVAMFDQRDLPGLYLHEGKIYEGETGKNEMYKQGIDYEEFQVKNYKAALHLLFNK